MGLNIIVTRPPTTSGIAATTPLYWNVPDIEGRDRLEHLCGHVGALPLPLEAKVSTPGCALAERNQPRDGAGRDVIVHDQKVGRHRELRNGSEVLDRIEAQLVQDRTDDHLRWLSRPTVYPSGGAFAMRSAAMLPAAPVTFSTTTGLRSSLVNCWPTRRATMSG
jgi:hypothetical protein